MKKSWHNQCPNCSSIFTLSGDAIDYSMLSPRRLARFRLSDNKKYEVSWPFTACLKCGLVWSTLYPALTGWKTDVEHEGEIRRLDNFSACPRCKSENISNGQPLPIDWNINSRQFKVFRPDGVSFWKLAKTIKILRQYMACIDCGLIYSFIDSSDLYRVLNTKGTHKTKKWLAEQTDAPDRDNLRGLS